MKNFIKQTSILSIAIAVAFVVYMGVQIAQGAGTWNPPSAVPPGNNTDEPINVSNSAQTKSGSLEVGGLLSNYSAYLATVSGSVGIGTASPDGKLGVKGDINFVPQSSVPTGNKGDLYYDNVANEFKYYDGNAWKSFTSSIPPGLSFIQIGGVGVYLQNSANIEASCQTTSDPMYSPLSHFNHKAYSRVNNNILQTKATIVMVENGQIMCDSDWKNGNYADCNAGAMPVTARTTPVGVYVNTTGPTSYSKCTNSSYG